MLLSKYVPASALYLLTSTSIIFSGRTRGSTQATKEEYDFQSKPNA